jgi:enterochelin esterase-like enzyme
MYHGKRARFGTFLMRNIFTDKGFHLTMKTRVLQAVFAVLSAILVSCFSSAAQSGSKAVTDKTKNSSLAPEVVHTGTAPTGYSVTFRYANPQAKKVQVKGEWLFARPSELPLLAGTPDHPVIEGQGIMPAEWKPGDFPLQRPNSTGPNFLVTEMTKGKDGVWTYTTPLPSGVFTYSYIVDCDNPTGARCPQIADPSNLPWTEKSGVTESSVARNSQVFVPSDPKFGTVDYSWQAPAKVQGKLTHETYPSPGHVTPKDKNYIVVYTPPGYDPARTNPYPTFYLSHGGGENELGWSTQGVVNNILDNLINTGQIQPIVVVMPNGGGFANSTFNEAYDRDMIDSLIPYVEKQYHVSTSDRDRAFSGLSMGGMLTNSFLINHPEVFQYYGMMSAGLPPQNSELTPAQIAALKGKSIWVGGGWQDVIHAVGFSPNGTPTHLGPAREVSTLAKAGIPVTTNFVYGGHEWYVWRILVKDFLTRFAFLPPTYAAWQ